MRLTKDFYLKYPSTQLAKSLLGKLLVHDSPDGRTSGIIVETESYLDSEPAAHSYVGITDRTRTIYEGHPGTSYVYFIYGMYSCFNVVSNHEGSGDAVLIRALEPIEGIKLMSERRLKYSKSKKDRIISIDRLCSGPGKLCVAMDITKEYNGIKLYSSESKLWIEDIKDGKEYLDEEIVTTTRVGITKAAELPLRFYIKGNKYISKS